MQASRLVAVSAKLQLESIGAKDRYPRFLYGKFKDLKRGLWEPQPGALIQMEQEERAAAATPSSPSVENAREMLAVAEKCGDTAGIAHWRQQIEEREAAAAAPKRPHLVPQKKTA